MGSTRLPGKVLLDLCGQPVLARVVERTARAKTLNRVVVATTTEPADQVLCDLCQARGWPSFCGSQEDVLDRYYRAAQEHAADVVVRITSDCPLIDPEVTDMAVAEFFRLQPDCDYLSNGEPPRPFPRGLDVEVFHFRALEEAWREARPPAFREHVTPFIYRHPQRFRLAPLLADGDFTDMRWTVDTPEDYALVRLIFEHFGHDRFGWRDVLDLLQAHTDWLELNRHVRQKTV
jgi:spore coat polysaccharide biosynthesis protein SpsF